MEADTELVKLAAMLAPGGVVQRFTAVLPPSVTADTLNKVGYEPSGAIDDFLQPVRDTQTELQELMVALGSPRPEADSYFLTKAASLVGDRLLAGLPVLAGVTGARIAREAALSRDDRAPVALGALAALPLALGGQMAAGHLANKAMRAERRLSPGEEKKVLAASGVHPDTPLETGEVDNAYFHMPGPLDRLFRLDTPEALRHGRVVLGTDYQSPAVLAHELGHADVAQNGSWLSRMNQQYGRPLSDGVQALATVGAAPIAGAALGPVGGLLAGGAAGLLAGAPTLFNEYQASSRGMKTLRRAGLPEEDVRAGRRGLTGAFGTYLAAAALPAAATGLGVGLLKDHLSKGAADRDTPSPDAGSAKNFSLDGLLPRYVTFNKRFDGTDHRGRPSPVAFEYVTGVNPPAGYGPLGIVSLGENKPLIQHGPRDPNDFYTALDAVRDYGNDRTLQGELMPLAEKFYHANSAVRTGRMSPDVYQGLEDATAAQFAAAMRPQGPVVAAGVFTTKPGPPSDPVDPTPPEHEGLGALAAVLGLGGVGLGGYGLYRALRPRRSTSERPKTAAAPAPTPVDLLRQAKAHSDRGDYAAKTQIVRDLIRKNPAAWRVDSELPPRFLGLTHSSGFRIHMPREAVLDVLPQAALPVLPVGEPYRAPLPGP